MADVAESDTAKVVVKKEVEENPESPDHVDVQDSPTSQADTNGGQKLTKVWSDNETRSMLEFHKSFMEKHDDGNYSKKQLLEDVAQELNVRGFDITPEKVRNKMKYLRARYKRMLEYNAKHAVKKTTPFQEELAELYNMPFFEDEPVVDVNGLNESVASSKSVRVKKKPKNHSASRVSLKSVLAAKKKGNAATKASKIIKKKAKARRTVHPLFQCGLCMDKFHSSSEMHGHSCNSTPVKVNHENKKKIVSRSPARALTLWLKPTGNAPILKNKKWTVEKTQTIATIMVFLKKYMNLEPSATMFLYVNQSFAPSPDIEVGSIYDCFNINGKLVLHYSTSPAWG